jgi:phosphoglycolate phosphatase-like HAD superfamily hydrolase
MTTHGEVDAVLLDFDGTIVDSVPLKFRAFQSIVESLSPEAVAPSMEYFWAHGGVSRYEKFRYVWTEILGRPMDPGRIEALAAEFHRRVYDLVVACRCVAGAEQFLEDCSERFPLFVVSGTPQGELDAVVRRRGMGRFFQGVHGSPPSKQETAGTILKKHGFRPDRVWFVGDATTDRDAARALGLRFVGLDGPHLTPYLSGGETVVSDLFQLRSMLVE